MVRNVKCGLLKDLVVQVDLALVGLDVHRLRVGVVLLQLQDAGLVFRDQPVRTAPVQQVGSLTQISTVINMRLSKK